METAEKKKIILVYILAGALVVLALLAALTYRSVLTGNLRRSAQAMGFQLALRRTAAAVTVAEETEVLQREQQKWDGYAAQLEQRLSQRQQELLLLVNPWTPLPEDYIVKTEEMENGLSLDLRCAADFARMMADCRAAGFRPYICSGYRTQDYQQELYDNKVMRVMATGVYGEEAYAEAAKSVALPGTSEHQLGLAADIMHEWYPYLNEYQERTSTQQWLMENSWLYGFILRYPNGSSDTTGIIYEPWHYRYVGRSNAKDIFESGLVLEDYLKVAAHNTAAASAG